MIARYEAAYAAIAGCATVPARPVELVTEAETQECARR